MIHTAVIKKTSKVLVHCFFYNWGQRPSCDIYLYRRSFMCKLWTWFVSTNWMCFSFTMKMGFNIQVCDRSTVIINKINKSHFVISYSIRLFVYKVNTRGSYQRQKSPWWNTFSAKIRFNVNWLWRQWSVNLFFEKYCKKYRIPSAYATHSQAVGP